MPRADALKNNFLLGEINARAKGQYQTEAYKAGVDFLKNWFVADDGALIPRPGTRHVYAFDLSGSNADSQLVTLRPFVFSKDEAYMLAFISSGVRAFASDLTSTFDSKPGVAIGGPVYKEAQYVQNGNVLFIAHDQFLYPLTLTRDSAGSFTYSTLNAWLGGTNTMLGPYYDEGHTGLTLTPSGVGAGANTYTASGSIFTSSDVGRKIWYLDNSAVYHSLVINSFIGPTQVTATSLSNGATAGGLGAVTAWALELAVPALLPDEGPRAIGIFQNRLVIGGYPGKPSRLAFSKSDNYPNFEPKNSDGSVDSATPIIIDFDDQKVDDIVWIRGTKQGCLVGTLGKEWLVTSADSTDAEVTASNIEAGVVSSFGSGQRNIAVGNNATLSVSVSKSLIRETYNDGRVFNTRTINTYGSDLTKRFIGDITVGQDPRPTVYCSVAEDVPGLSDNYKDQGVAALYREGNSGIFAPSRIQLGGIGDADGNPPKIISVGVKPSPDGSYDELWLATKRYINGAYTWNVEFLTREFDNEDAFGDSVDLDSSGSEVTRERIRNVTQANPAVITLNATSSDLVNTDSVRISGVEGMTQLNGNTYTLANKSTSGGFVTFELSGVDSTGFTAFTQTVTALAKKAISSVSGLSHLEGETVQVVAEGVQLDDKVVSSGSISLGGTYTDVHVGYKYNCDLRLLRPDAGSATGTALGKTQRIHRVSVHVDRLVNLKVGKDFDNLFELRKGKTDLFTGVLSENVDVDYELGNRVCLRKDKPLPGSILAITQHLSTQDR